jgi:ubiquinone/menaquinone biosynthesis C-methylase UbiE
MDPRLQRRVQRYGWNKAVEVYEAFWQEQLAPAQERLLDLAALAPGERVIDIACGTGLVTFPAAECVGPNGVVLATDLAERMVTHVVAEAQRRGLPQVRAERMDAEQLSVADGAFDVALDALGLMYVPDPLQAAREMHRALRRGGRAVAAVWGRRSACGWAEIFPIVDRRVSSDVCPMFFQLGTGDGLTSVMTQAGFVDVEADCLSVVLEYASAEKAYGAAFAGGPVALAYSRFDGATREEAHAEYIESIEAFRADDGYRIPGEFVVVRGRTAS